MCLVWLAACLQHWVCASVCLFRSVSVTLVVLPIMRAIIVCVTGGVRVAVISEVVGVQNAGCVCTSIIAVRPGALKHGMRFCVSNSGCVGVPLHVWGWSFNNWIVPWRQVSPRASLGWEVGVRGLCVSKNYAPCFHCQNPHKSSGLVLGAPGQDW